MLKRKVRLKITTTNRESVCFQNLGLRARCFACNLEVEMVSDDEAVRILNGSNSILEHLVNAGRVHTLQTENGNLWICKESLFRR